MGNNGVIDPKYIFLDVDIKSQKAAFEFIAKNAVAMGISKNKSALVQGFINREAEGTTGFEDGFAIPHARIKEVDKAAVFVVRFKKGIDWKSMDGKPTKVAIALMVPEGPNGDEHLSILSGVAQKLMDDKFKKTLLTSKTKKSIYEALTNDGSADKKPAAKKETKTAKANDKKLNILAITACTVGVAHTYMAETALLKAVPQMGYNIRVETHGSKGVGTPFTDDEIKNADLVIFATDVDVDKSRFVGKRFYHVKVAKAIKDPERVVNDAIKEATVLQGSGDFDTDKSKNAPKDKDSVLQHIMAGVSYMIPVIILGGICLAFSLGIAKIIWGPESGPAGPNDEYKWGILNVLNIIGGAAFTLMIPILGGFIANSIGGRAAIAPAMVGSFIGNTPADFWTLNGALPEITTPTGFVGAIIAGLLVGYFVRWVNTWKVPNALRAAMPIFFIPLMAGIGISLLFIYVIGGPIGWVMHQVEVGITNAYEGGVGIGVGLGLGLLLGAMAGFDMGGPINKVAFLTCSTLVTMGIYQPMGAMAAAIPVAPLGMAVSTFLVPKFFNKDERGLGVAAFIMGCIGISEGAIPFALRDPRRAIVCNALGSAVAGGIAGALKVQDYAAHGGPIVAILGAVPYGLETLYFFIAIIVGVAVTGLLYTAWMLIDAGQPGSVKERYVAYLDQLRATKKNSIENANDEMKQLKASFKANYKDAKKAGAQEADLQKMKADYDVKVNSIKETIAQAKNDFKVNSANAKKAYKEMSKPEKEYLKENASTIRQAYEQISENYKQQIESYRTQLSSVKGDSSLSKLDRDNETKDIKAEILKAKKLSHQEKIDTKVVMRKQYVDQYEKALNIK